MQICPPGEVDIALILHIQKNAVRALLNTFHYLEVILKDSLVFDGREIGEIAARKVNVYFRTD